MSMRYMSLIGVAAYDIIYFGRDIVRLNPL